METNDQPISPITNKHSIISLIFGILTIIAFCTGWLPIPFTGFVCFPTSVIFGITALLIGLISLNRIRKHNQTGHPMAWTGIAIGGFVLLCVLCMVVTLVSLFYFSPSGTIPTPPFFKNF